MDTRITGKFDHNHQFKVNRNAQLLTGSNSQRPVRLGIEE